MNLNDNHISLSHRSCSPQTDNSNPDCDDSEDESDQDIQHILRTVGRNDCSISSPDYYDSRRYEIMYEMMNVEKQFDELKTILYEESILFIDRKLLAIENEEAPEYQHELTKLYDEMKVHLDVAKRRHDIELQALENATQSELLSLNQTLENDKALLYHHMQENLQEQIDEIENLKMKSELSANILQEIHPSEHQQSMKRRDPTDPMKATNRKKARTVDKDNLAIFYQLSDMNIVEDWAIIQTSLQRSPIVLDESDGDESDIQDDTTH